MRLEKLGQRLTGTLTLKTEPDVNVVKPIIQAKLQDILNKFKTVGILDKEQARRLSTRVQHIFNRMSDIPEDTEGRSEMMTKILQLMDVSRKAQKSATPLVVSLVLEPEETDNSDAEGSSFVESSEEEEVEATSTPKGSSCTHDLSKSYETVARWNVRFSGETGVSVHGFLERIEELRTARKVSKSALFSSAADLFEGKARNWYRANKNRFNNWNELVDLLKLHYEPPDYKSRLFNDILARTQGPNEPIVEYLSCMSAMFNRYGYLSDEAQLDIILRNLSPFYTTQLPDVNSIAQLETEALKLEVRKFRAEHYRPPARDSRAYVDAQFMCMTSNCDISETTPSSSQVKVLVCSVCGRKGHIAKDCQSKHLKCYKCGKVGYKVNTCPKCSYRLGNGKQGSGKAGPRP